MTHSINKLTLRRCDANRSAASASEDRIATRLSRSILTSEFRRASRSRTMFTCSRVPKSADFDLRPLYLMAMRKPRSISLRSCRKRRRHQKNNGNGWTTSTPDEREQQQEILRRSASRRRHHVYRLVAQRELRGVGTQGPRRRAVRWLDLPGRLHVDSQRRQALD